MKKADCNGNVHLKVMFTESKSVIKTKNERVVGRINSRGQDPDEELATPGLWIGRTKEVRTYKSRSW